MDFYRIKILGRRQIVYYFGVFYYYGVYYYGVRLYIKPQMSKAMHAMYFRREDKVSHSCLYIFIKI